MKPKLLPVNFHTTHEQPMADLPRDLACHAAVRAHFVGLADLPHPPIPTVDQLDPVDLAVLLLCRLRAKRLYSISDAALAAAFHLDAHHIRLILQTTKRRVKL